MWTRRGLASFGKREGSRREIALGGLLGSFSPAVFGSAQRCLQPFGLWALTTCQAGELWAGLSWCPQRTVGWVMQWPNVKEPPFLACSAIHVKGTSKQQERSSCAGLATGLGWWPPVSGRPVVGAGPQAQQLQKCPFRCIWRLLVLQILLRFPRYQFLGVTRVRSQHVPSAQCAGGICWVLCLVAPVCIQQQRLLLSQDQVVFQSLSKALRDVFFYSFSSVQSMMHNKNK